MTSSVCDYTLHSLVTAITPSSDAEVLSAWYVWRHLQSDALAEDRTRTIETVQSG